MKFSNYVNVTIIDENQNASITFNIPNLILICLVNL